MSRILSVEDDPDLQHLVSYALRNQGFEVHYAFTGPEGLEKAFQLNPDLILLDMMLPGLNGAEVARRLKARKETRAIPIVVLTSYPDDAEFLESAVRAIGVVEYLRKPVRADELVAHVRRLLSGRGDPAPLSVRERGDIRAVVETRTVTIGGRTLAALPPKRFALLLRLLACDGEAAWEDLVRAVWGDAGTKNDLEKTIQRLREDLGPDAARLSTTRRGYRLE
jgi:DNA-binding response OmpR family regulator